MFLTEIYSENRINKILLISTKLLKERQRRNYFGNKITSAPMLLQELNKIANPIGVNKTVILERIKID